MLRACHMTTQHIVIFKLFFFGIGDGRVPLITSKLTSHMSILHMCNACGRTLPPMYVFSGKNLINNMLEGAPDGT
jgi:hypothetical protein